MSYGLTLVTPPTAEPLDATATKLWLRLKQDAEDSLVNALISAARRRCERVSGRQLVTATWQVTFDRFPALSLYLPPRYGLDALQGFAGRPPDPFPNALRMPLPPLQSVSSITYAALDGTTQTLDLATVRVISSRQPGMIVPAINNTWPYVAAVVPDAVTVQFVAGYGAAGSVPGDVKQALLRCVAHEYEFREAADEDYLDRLFAPFWDGSY